MNEVAILYYRWTIRFCTS